MAAVTLPAPSAPVYPTLSTEEQRDADVWAEIVIEGTPSRWPRPQLIVAIMMTTFDQELAKGSSAPAIVDKVARTLTAALESLGETEIASPGIAALYVLSDHPEWRAAASQLLPPGTPLPFNPETTRYHGLVRLIRHRQPDIPAWLEEKAQ